MNQQKLRADAHKQIEEIFKTLLPARGLSYREAQAQLSHTMLDALLDGKIALCDAGTGIGKTFSYLVAGAVFDQARCRDGCTHQPLVISTSSIALQRAVKYEYLPLLSSVLLDAGYLEDAFRPLQERISIPPEGQPFNNYAELLKIPYQVLSTVESKLLHQLSHLLRRNLQKLRSVISTLLDFEHQENLVCYAEENQGSTKLCATLYDLGGPMKKLLWNRPQGMILTSGTMAVGTDFLRFRTETGLTDSYRVIESVWESLFDYLDHALLYLPEYPPRQFGGRQDLYYDALAGEIARLIRAASGHTLVLFTSYVCSEGTPAGAGNLLSAAGNGAQFQPYHAAVSGDARCCSFGHRLSLGGDGFSGRYGFPVGDPQAAISLSQ